MTTTTSLDQNARARLLSYIERAERLNEEKETIAQDLRELYAEAKGNGYDVKALREIVKLRKQDAGERKEHEAILETYMHALGMLATTELGQAALARKQDELAKAGRKLASEMMGDKRAAPAARPDDKLTTPIPIPAQSEKPQVGQAGIRSGAPGQEWPDGAERPPIANTDSMPFAPASDLSAPPSQRSDLGGADDFLGVPAFLRRTADNGVPA